MTDVRTPPDDVLFFVVENSVSCNARVDGGCGFWWVCFYALGARTGELLEEQGVAPRGVDLHVVEKVSTKGVCVCCVSVCDAYAYAYIHIYGANMYVLHMLH